MGDNANEPPGGKRRRTHEYKNEDNVPAIPDDSDSIEMLNDDCLASIIDRFSYPERLVAESVSKRWRRLAKRSWVGLKELFLRKSLLLSCDFESIGLSKNPNTYSRRILKNCGNYLTKLTIDEFGTSTALCLIGQYCPNITSLSVKLQTFKIGSMKFLSHLEQLEEFSIGAIETSTIEEVLQFVQTQNLCKIRFSALLNSDNVVTLPSNARRVFPKLRNLHSLALDCIEVTDEMCQAISRMSFLTELELNNCCVLNLNFMMRLFDLEQLMLYDDGICNEFLGNLARNCLNLVSLYFHSPDNDAISDIGLEYLEKLQRLEKLTIVGQRRISDYSFARFAQLKELWCINCENVQDRGLIRLLEIAPELSYLLVPGTKVTKALLVAANRITKVRQNGITLRVVVDHSLMAEWTADDHTSSLLSVEPDGNAINE